MKLFLVLEFYHETHTDDQTDLEYKELIRHRFERGYDKEKVVNESFLKATEFIQLEMEKRYEKATDYLGEKPMWNVKDAVIERVEKLIISVHEINEKDEVIHIINRLM